MKKVCITEDWELVNGTLDTPNHPKKNEIVIVVGNRTEEGEHYYKLQGYGNDYYNSKFFRDLNYDFVDKVLSEIKSDELILT